MRRFVSKKSPQPPKTLAQIVFILVIKDYHTSSRSTPIQDSNLHPSQAPLQTIELRRQLGINFYVYHYNPDVGFDIPQDQIEKYGYLAEFWRKSTTELDSLAWGVMNGTGFKEVYFIGDDTAYEFTTPVGSPSGAVWMAWRKSHWYGPGGWNKTRYDGGLDRAIQAALEKEGIMASELAFGAVQATFVKRRLEQEMSREGSSRKRGCLDQVAQATRPRDSCMRVESGDIKLLKSDLRLRSQEAHSSSRADVAQGDENISHDTPAGLGQPRARNRTLDGIQNHLRSWAPEGQLEGKKKHKLTFSNKLAHDKDGKGEHLEHGSIAVSSRSSSMIVEVPRSRTTRGLPGLSMSSRHTRLPQPTFDEALPSDRERPAGVQSQALGADQARSTVVPDLSSASDEELENSSATREHWSDARRAVNVGNNRRSRRASTRHPLAEADAAPVGDVATRDTATNRDSFLDFVTKQTTTIALDSSMAQPNGGGRFALLPQDKKRATSDLISLSPSIRGISDTDVRTLGTSSTIARSSRTSPLSAATASTQQPPSNSSLESSPSISRTASSFVFSSPSNASSHSIANLASSTASSEEGEPALRVSLRDIGFVFYTYEISTLGDTAPRESKGVHQELEQWRALGLNFTTRTQINAPLSREAIRNMHDEALDLLMSPSEYEYQHHLQALSARSLYTVLLVLDREGAESKVAICKRGPALTNGSETAYSAMYPDSSTISRHSDLASAIRSALTKEGVDGILVDVDLDSGTPQHGRAIRALCEALQVREPRAADAGPFTLSTMNETFTPEPIETPAQDNPRAASAPPVAAENELPDSSPKSSDPKSKRNGMVFEEDQVQQLSESLKALLGEKAQSR